MEGFEDFDFEESDFKVEDNPREVCSNCE